MQAPAAATPGARSRRRPLRPSPPRLLRSSAPLRRHRLPARRPLRRRRAPRLRDRPHPGPPAPRARATTRSRRAAARAWAVPRLRGPATTPTPLAARRACPDPAADSAARWRPAPRRPTAQPRHDADTAVTRRRQRPVRPALRSPEWARRSRRHPHRWSRRRSRRRSRRWSSRWRWRRLRRRARRWPWWSRRRSSWWRWWRFRRSRWRSPSRRHGRRLRASRRPPWASAQVEEAASSRVRQHGGALAGRRPGPSR